MVRPVATFLVGLGNIIIGNVNCLDTASERNIFDYLNLVRHCQLSSATYAGLFVVIK